LIKVQQQPEYMNFDRDVRQPGAQFLRSTPHPSSAQFKKKNFWQKSLTELHTAYKGVCAYTAMYLPDKGSVDHFQPKSTHPHLAYEWTNFRLASGRVNCRKGKSNEVLDPFSIEDGWYQLELPSCLIRSNPNLSKDERIKINKSINILGLNQDETLVDERCSILISLALEELTIEFLRKRYPFLAFEVERQEKLSELRDIFRV